MSHFTSFLPRECRLRSHGLLLLALACTAGALAQSNDNFAGRITMSGPSFTTSPVLMDNATLEPGETTTPSKSIWYSWTAPDNVNVSLSTQGSTPSTGTVALVVGIGGSLPTLSTVTTGGATATFPAVRGLTYHFGIFFQPTARGSAVLSLNSAPYTSGGIVVGPDQPTTAIPANDNFSGRKTIDSLPAAIVSYHHDATRESGEASHGFKTLWYSFTPAIDGVVSLRLEALEGFTVFSDPTRIAIYHGPAFDQLVRVRDYTMSVQDAFNFAVVRGVTYHLSIGDSRTDYERTVRRVSLQIAPATEGNPIVGPAEPVAPAPRNDNFAGRQQLSGSRLTAVAYTSAATREAFEATGTTTTTGNFTVWYSWVANQDGTLALTLGGDTFNKIVTIYTGVDLPTLTQVGRSTNGTLNVAVRGGTAYAIAVGSVSTSESGNILLGLAGPGVVFPTPGGAAAPRFINIATRGFVGTGTNALVGGFVISDGPRTVLIRAVGPGLGAFGVPGTLVDPKLELFQGSTLMATNENWGSAGDAAVIAAAATQSGGFPLANGSRDACLLVTLPPGAYTAQITGADGGTGVAILEVYEIR